MGSLSIIIGILAAIGMVIGFIPCFGWFNWLNIPLATLGLIFGLLGLLGFGNGDKAKAGIIVCAVVILVGLFRLSIGGGIF